MSAAEFLSKLSLILSDFELHICQSNCIHGTKKVPLKRVRDTKGATINVLGLRNIFISCVMGTDDKPFHYCTVYTVSSSRGYRCKKWYNNEYHKVFISGKDYDAMLENIKERINEIND